MSITPAELRHLRFAQVRRGYDTEAVDRALESVAEGLDELLRERADLEDRVRQLESDLSRYRDMESTLTDTLTLAERAAGELLAEAQADADRIREDARTSTSYGSAAPPQSALPDPAFIELLGETRAIRSLLQTLMQGGSGESPFSASPGSS